MDRSFYVNDVNYTTASFGSVVTSYRIKRGWSQVELARRVYKLMHNDNESGFNKAAGRVKIGRIESGRFKPGTDFAEALVATLNIKSNTSSDLDLKDYPVDLIIKEITAIIERIPQPSAANLLSIARMISQGGLNNN